MEHLSRERLEAGLDHVRESPQDHGRLVLLVRRPEVGQRDLPREAVLDQITGLAGDNWLTRQFQYTGRFRAPGQAGDGHQRAAG